MIEIRKLSVAIEAGPVLLKEFSLDLKCPEIVGVYGPNGSGKTTLFKGIRGDEESGWLRRGEFWLNGKRIDFLSVQKKAEVCLRFGSELKSEFPISVREFLELTMELMPLREGANLDLVLQWTQLGALASKKISYLSDGERQRLILARAILQKSDVLFFDETFSKVDPQYLKTVEKCLRWLKQMNVYVFVISHDINFLSEVSDQLLLFGSGEVKVQGAAQEVLNHENLTAIYPHTDFQMIRSANSGKIKVIF